MEGGEGDKKECKFKHHRHGPKFHHFKRGPLKCQKCGEEIEFKWEKPKEGEPRKRPEPPKCQKCGAVWERPKPKCPFCQAELPKPDFKKFKKPEGKPEKKEDASSSSSSSSEDEGEKKEKKEEPKEKPKFEKPKCPNCQKELPFFWGRHGHRHGFRGFGPHGGFHGHGPHGPHGPEKKDA
jgi:hypothetical protein